MLVAHQLVAFSMAATTRPYYLYLGRKENNRGLLITITMKYLNVFSMSLVHMRIRVYTHAYSLKYKKLQTLIIYIKKYIRQHIGKSIDRCIDRNTHFHAETHKTHTHIQRQLFHNSKKTTQRIYYDSRLFITVSVCLNMERNVMN